MAPANLTSSNQHAILLILQQCKVSCFLNVGVTHMAQRKVQLKNLLYSEKENVFILFVVNSKQMNDAQLDENRMQR
jgi:hypothetical protein